MAVAALVLNNRNLKVKQISAHKLINKLWYHHKMELYLEPTEIHNSMDESQKHYAEPKKSQIQNSSDLSFPLYMFKTCKTNSQWLKS